MWSSWPCVITKPLIFSLFFTKYVTSGITKSTPNILSSGNSNPQSTNTISSSYSKIVMFFPISSKPPNGMIFKLGFLNSNFKSGFWFLIFSFFTNSLSLAFLSFSIFSLFTPFFAIFLFSEISLFVLMLFLLSLCPSFTLFLVILSSSLSIL